MVFPLHTTTTSAQETKTLGASLGAYVLSQSGDSKPSVVCLYGALGSGKTTFTQGFAQGLGITNRILSPTFVIVRHYTVPKSKHELYHVDLYRLQSEEDMVSVGIPEMFDDQHAFVCVEWPERLGNLIPKSRLEIKFTTLSSGGHRIQGQKI